MSTRTTYIIPDTNSATITFTSPIPTVGGRTSDAPSTTTPTTTVPTAGNVSSTLTHYYRVFTSHLGMVAFMANSVSWDPSRLQCVTDLMKCPQPNNLTYVQPEFAREEANNSQPVRMWTPVDFHPCQQSKSHRKSFRTYQKT
ncbi:hypothetical protein SprV_0200920600 [Sparganum proliferum]